MNRLVNLSMVLGVASLLCLATASHAQTDIDFSQTSLSNGALISSSYDSDAAGTPNVTVGYQQLTTSNTFVRNQLAYWGTEYGDLTGVAYSYNNGYVAEIDLTPAAGYSVTLSSFEMAGYYGNYNATVLKVTDGVNTDDYTGGSSYAVTGTGHNTFTPNFTSTGTVRIDFGTDYDLGINHIVFSQNALSTPEPGVYALLGTVGLTGAAFLRRRRA